MRLREQGTPPPLVAASPPPTALLTPLLLRAPRGSPRGCGVVPAPGAGDACGRVLLSVSAGPRWRCVFSPLMLFNWGVPPAPVG